MTNFLAGLVLGAAATWFWICFKKQNSSFQNVLNKQLSGGLPAEPPASIWEELSSLKKQIADLEDNLSSDPRVGREKHPANGTAGRLERMTAEPNKSEVLRLWEEGRNRQKIVSLTGLGQGKVDLILSLQRYSGEKGAATNYGKGDPV